jgi:hypothetical protein
MKPIGPCSEHIRDRKLFRSRHRVTRRQANRPPAPSPRQRNSLLKMPAFQQLANRYTILQRCQQ